MKTMAQEYDCLLIDLDGTVFRGSRPTEGAVQSLDQVDSRKLYVTNNASRSADEVAAHLRELGFTATSTDVVTSAQSAAHLLAAQLPPDARVLVVGTESLANEIAAVGLRPVRKFDDRPVAVVQGLSLTIGWPDLAEGGLRPGKGSLGAALRAATDAEPQVAGKPAPTLLNDAVARGDFRNPLVIGDRLDTDIEGANAAELPSLMVLTGVSTALDAVYAGPAQRPSYIARDLRSLHENRELLAVGRQEGWHVTVAGEAVTVTAKGDQQGDELSIVRAVASAVWGAKLDGQRPRIGAGDERARDALNRWSLMHDD
jgi:glycerol 3-phosphatase-2